ncbi:MAG: hypothetical protein ACYSOO_05560 [Planctomycetota bacterium]|jgi:hypothetical protein
MTKQELILKLEKEVKGLHSYLVKEDYENAADDAINEFESSWPVSGQLLTFWVKRRAKRHLFFYLMTESAHKFKFEQINLQHRFDHYSKLIETEDKAFEVFIEERPDLFAGVDSFKMFGTKIDAGFAYAEHGTDITYDEDQKVEFDPKESA